ncbi:MAG: PDZ domain-containing protein [Planctomycetota bacterium]
MAGKSPAVCEEFSLGTLDKLSKAVRKATDQWLPHIVTVETIGALEGQSGEIRGDVPISGVVIEKGFVLSSDLILRQPSAAILVVDQSGKRFSATVHARDRHRDLVLLRIEGDGLPPGVDPKNAFVEFEPTIGRTAIAVGRYRDQSPMMARGIVSATERLNNKAVQIDARVSPAFYGGPVIDLTGRLIGLSIPAVGDGMASDATGWYDSGIAFAIDAGSLAKSWKSLSSGDDLYRGLIGIVASARDPLLSDTKIAAVRPRSPAASAGLQVNDVVTEVNEVPVRKHQDIRQVIGRLDAGDTVKLGIKRGDESLDVSMELARSIPPLRPQTIGVSVAEIDDNNAKEESRIVRVTGVAKGSPADGILQVDDEITVTGLQPISGRSDLEGSLVTHPAGTSLKLRIVRENNGIDLDIKPVTIRGELSGWRTEVEKIADLPKASVEELRLAESSLKSFLLAPDPTNLRDSQPYALVLHLLPHSDSEIRDSLEEWQDAVKNHRLIVLAVAPANETEWLPQESESLVSLVKSLKKRFNIDDDSVSVVSHSIVTGTANADESDTMALATCISQSETFTGMAISSQTTPPAIRLVEADGVRPTEVLIEAGAEDELPTWSAALSKAGYPVLWNEKVEREIIAAWTTRLSWL